LNWRTPTEWLLGYTPDSSVFLQFRFYEPVYYALYGGKLPQDSTEAMGRFVGIAQHVGHAITFKVLTEEDKVIQRSVVRSANNDGAFMNLRADEAAHGKVVAKDGLRTRDPILHSRRGRQVAAGSPLPTLDPSSLLGRIFLRPEPAREHIAIRGNIEHVAYNAMDS